MTIHLGWWLIPAIITIIGLIIISKETNGGGSYAAIGNFIVAAFYAIPILVMWIIYLLIRLILK